ncbi:MAG: LAGLIDADG family homing endonuclease [Candidatus Aenigmatarchaeota archaeon]
MKLKSLRLMTPVERLRIYEKVQMLRANKLSINKISRVLKITPKTVKHLIKNRPSLRYGFFKPKPCKELSYIIGVCFGDASLYKQKNYHYKIELRAKDKEFVEKFSYCLAFILDKKPNKIYEDGKYFRIQVGCKSLYNFLAGKKLKDLKYVIEKYPKEFLQGLFDSEGCPHVEANKGFVVKVGLVSTSLELLKYVKQLLKKFKIDSKITMCIKPGSSCTFDKKRIVRKKYVYRLIVHKFCNTKKFAVKIGFTSKRKQEKLVHAIFIKESSKSQKEAVCKWKFLYKKVGREWLKINNG